MTENILTEFDAEFQTAFEYLCNRVVKNIDMRAALDGIKYTDYATILDENEKKNFLFKLVLTHKYLKILTCKSVD